MLRLSAIAGLLLGCCALARAAAGDEPAWRSAIVHIVNDGAGIVCTGVLVKADLVATAGHCLGGATARDLFFIPAGTSIAVQGKDLVAAGGMTEGAEVTVVTVGQDWALIRIEPLSIAPIQIVPITHTQVRRAIADGARLVSLGFGAGSQLRQHPECGLLPIWGDAFFTTSCDVHPGDSGGPVLLVTGAGARLIGINSAIRSDAALVVSARRFAQWADDADPFIPRALVAASGPQTSPSKRGQP